MRILYRVTFVLMEPFMGAAGAPVSSPAEKTITPAPHPPSSVMPGVVITVLSIIIIGLGAYTVSERQRLARNTNEETTNQTTSTSGTVEPYVAIPKQYVGASVSLPSPVLKGSVSIEETLQNRRSRRAYAEEPLTLQELSQLLWAAQGITNDKGGRTAPSGRSIYPIELYVVAKNVATLAPGVYHYIPQGHKLGLLIAGTDTISTFADANTQDPPKKAPAVLAISGISAKARPQFKDEAEMVVHQESGHISQNVYLETEALGLGTVTMGGFDEGKISDILKLPADETIVYLMPVGHRGVETAE